MTPADEHDEGEPPPETSGHLAATSTATHEDRSNGVRSGSGRLRSFVAGLFKPLPAAILLAVIGAAVGLGSGWVTDNVFPPTKSVALSHVCLQSGLTGAEYSNQVDGVPLNAPPSETVFKNVPGLTVGVVIDVRGFDSSSVNVDGVVFDAVHGNWDPSWHEAETGIGYYRVVPLDAASVLRDPQFWVPLPTKPGRYVVRVDVWDSDYQFRLASTHGPPFVITPNGALTLTNLCTA